MFSNNHFSMVDKRFYNDQDNAKDQCKYNYNHILK